MLSQVYRLSLSFIFKEDNSDCGNFFEPERHSLIELNYSLPAYVSERRGWNTISLGDEHQRLSTLSLVRLASVPNIGVMGLDESDERKMKPIDWLQDYQFYLIGLCFVSSRLIYMISITYIVYYAEFTLLLEKEFNSIVLIVMFSSGFIMAPIVEIAQKRISRNIIFAVSCILGLGENHKQ